MLTLEQNHQTQNSDRDMILMKHLLFILVRSMRELDTIPDHLSDVHIPNSHGILFPLKDLCHDDCPWIEKTPEMNYIHPSIDYELATSLGVRRKEEAMMDNHVEGLPFGQKEKLQNSIRRVLQNYPSKYDVLKELIQNADDAGATKIHFIRDTRQHPKEKLFGGEESSWQSLQGPALCVYNNRPFTNEDLRGIQNMGEGSKQRDPCKTGQYGIGFSTVYHLTDTPSILTQQDGVGKTLCVFDPLVKYVPGASEGKPGRRYEINNEIESTFSDVFSCYLPNIIDITKGCLIRLPLRTQEMADTSSFGVDEILPEDIYDLLDKLKEELFHILLFTNNLVEIVISDVNEMG